MFLFLRESAATQSESMNFDKTCSTFETVYEFEYVFVSNWAAEQPIVKIEWTISRPKWLMD